jgi:hypothetical protein
MLPVGGAQIEPAPVEINRIRRCSGGIVGGCAGATTGGAGYRFGKGRFRGVNMILQPATHLMSWPVSTWDHRYLTGRIIAQCS